MNKEYQISVLMGIYNCADTLQEALDSLYAQSYQDFEIILCDDGSSDNTYALAEDNARLHDNIVLIKNDKNLGLNRTLNKCLKQSSGKYIARMDGDDVSLCNRFELECQFLDSHPEYDIVSCNMIYFDEDGEFKRGTNPAHQVDYAHFIKGTPFCHAPCMVRREAYELVNGYSVEEKLIRVEDYHLWYKMYLKGIKGYNLSECLYKMRDDRKAIARRKFKYRVNESYVKYLIARDFKLGIKAYLYCLKPIIVALLPNWLYKYLHRSN